MIEFIYHLHSWVFFMNMVKIPSNSNSSSGQLRLQYIMSSLFLTTCQMAIILWAPNIRRVNVALIVDIILAIVHFSAFPFDILFIKYWNVHFNSFCCQFLFTFFSKSELFRMKLLNRTVLKESQTATECID